jgi:hypothetical protein
MGPNKYQFFLICIIAVLWLGVGNLIIYDAIRKKRLPVILIVGLLCLIILFYVK